MTRRLRALGFTVVSSELRTEGVEADEVGRDFLTWEPARWDCIVTNFPFSIKYLMIERAMAMGKPWASIVPWDTVVATRCRNAFDATYEHTRRGMEVVIPAGRINFKMPNKGFGGSAQFHSVWLGWKMGMPVLPREAFVPMQRRAQGQDILREVA